MPFPAERSSSHGKPKALELPDHELKTLNRSQNEFFLFQGSPLPAYFITAMKTGEHKQIEKEASSTVVVTQCAVVWCETVSQHPAQ